MHLIITRLQIKILNYANKEFTVTFIDITNSDWYFLIFCHFSLMLACLGFPCRENKNNKTYMKSVSQNLGHNRKGVRDSNFFMDKVYIFGKSTRGY